MKRGNKRKFGREKNQRKALSKALATALIDHGRIKTTVAKAKLLSKFADELVNRAKKGDLASNRLLRYSVGDKAVKKLIVEIGPKFKDKNGGYTKILKLGRRVSDGSEMAIVEFSQ